MQNTVKRRTFLKGGLAAGAASVAVGAGILAPSTVLAEWNAAAFEAKDAASVLAAIGGDGSNGFS